jgi:hypothetical protein
MTGRSPYASGVADSARPTAPVVGMPPSPPAVAPVDRRPLKIGIVSPYGYPHPGGVNEHVRHTYDSRARATSSGSGRGGRRRRTAASAA